MSKVWPSFGFFPEQCTTAQDYVSATKGGIFNKVIGYKTALEITGATQLVYKSWVENYVSANTLNTITTDSNILGAEILYNNNILKLADNIPTLDDTSNDYTKVLSAGKVLELLQSIKSVDNSYTITLSGGSNLTQKLIGAIKPSGWELSSDSGNLHINHPLEKTPVSIAVYRVTYNGSKHKLEGNTAYSSAASINSDGTLVLYSYASTEDITEIRLNF